MKNIIGITMGDPKGIGPEIIAKSWKALSEEERAQYRIYGDRNVMDAAALLTDVEISAKNFIACSGTSEAIGSISDQEGARIALSAINAAIEDIRSKRISALVTAPVNKHRIGLIQPGFLGHTEYLAQSAGVSEPIMMFFSEGKPIIGDGTCAAKQICISLVTMHIPIREVPKAITRERVLTAISRTRDALVQHFACPEPRIAVMSLNPHAGEHGTIGHEETESIIPAIEEAMKEGISCSGPLPADGLFKKMSDFDYDAVVAMYHDQGLLPAKLICQGKCVNITLGLPYIRTSPSHGTAEDIAWLGQADHENMLVTMRLTRRLLGWTIEAEGDEITGWT